MLELEEVLKVNSHMKKLRHREDKKLFQGHTILHVFSIVY